MLGWHISVYRQVENGSSPATDRSSHGVRLAVWQTGLYGLGWLDELVRDGKAVDLGGDGYPLRYTATAESIIPHIIDGPPEARQIWALDTESIVIGAWEGRTVVDRDAVLACPPDEWLLIEAWDES